MDSFVVRPQVGMHQMMAVPYVVALGVCDALPQAGIAWPYDVVDTSTGQLLCGVTTQGGYDDEGMYVQVRLSLDDGQPDVRSAVLARVDKWAAMVGPTPLGAVLNDYANALVQLGKEVRVEYPNGREHVRGAFVGVDVWGRATVRLASGKQIEFPPEKYRIR